MYLAGNPIAYTVFEDIYFKYFGSVLAVAYLSHDTLFRRCAFVWHSSGVGNVAPAPLLWIN